MNSTLFFDYFHTPDNLSIRYGMIPRAKNCRGTVLFLNGRSEFMEKHFETLSGLHERGFRVCSMDWRGQGMSSRMLPNAHKGYVKSYDDYQRDLAQFLREIVVPGSDGGPLILLCHSMGAHIALRYLHDHPEGISCAVMVSPMIDIRTPPFPPAFARRLVAWGMAGGYAEHYAPTQKDFCPPDRRSFRSNPLTHDFDRYMDEKRAVDANPRLALGGVTYGWLRATFDSVDILCSPGYMSRVTTPLLMLRAAEDRVVSLPAQDMLCSSMKNCRIITIAGAYHEILKEKIQIRKAFWKAFEEFVENNT
jgi:lysophospholipase